jgi:hypothetical protein
MRFGRPVAVVVLSVALVGMAVHYGAVVDAHTPYPTAGALAADYDSHVGEEFYMWMDVVGVEGDTLVVRNGPDGTLTLRAVSTSVDAAPGDVVQIYGVLDPDNRVAVRRIVVSGQRDRQSMLLVSAAAVPLVVGLFARRWTVDWDRYAFVPRGDRDG